MVHEEIGATALIATCIRDFRGRRDHAHPVLWHHRRSARRGGKIAIPGFYKGVKDDAQGDPRDWKKIGCGKDAVGPIGLKEGAGGEGPLGDRADRFAAELD